MSDQSTNVHRCCQCHAPLTLSRAQADIIRCLYCGSDHRITNAKSDQELLLHQEKRMGALVAPYLIAPLVGFFAFMAFRDFLWSPYEGKPDMLIGALFLALGLMSFRMPAALGLALIGIVGVLKPFIRPIPLSWEDVGNYSPTSEISFHYVIPGVICLVVAFGFFASLKVREVKPALQAVIPRLTVLVVGVVGIVAGYFVVGESVVEVATSHQTTYSAFETLSRQACAGELEPDLTATIEPEAQFYKRGSGEKNTLMVSCGRLPGADAEKADPLLFDELDPLQKVILGRSRFYHRGANDTDRKRYAKFAGSDFLVVIHSDNVHHTARLISVRSKKILREAQVSGLTNGVSVGSQLLRLLAGEMSIGSTPVLENRVVTPDRVVIPAKKKEVPPSADFVFHSTRQSGNTLYIYGLVTNTSEIPIGKAQVLAIFKDKDGKEVGLDRGYAAYALNVGETSPVALTIEDPPTYTTIDYEVHARKPLGLNPALGLIVTQHLEKTGTTTLVDLSGKVKNQGTTTAKFVTIHVAVFDTNTKLVALLSTIISRDSLRPGEEARFLFTGIVPSEIVGPPRFEYAVHARIDDRE